LSQLAAHAILTRLEGDGIHKRGPSLLEQYGRAGILLLFGLLFPLLPLIGSFALSLIRIRPKDPNPIKADTYECGVETEGDAWGQFNFRYYLFALVFVIFDIEVVFLYPWAVAFRQVKLFGFVEAVIFVLVLVLGYVYAWRKHALEWR
jgi:NADH-quinone oxidoreductase subunit A